MKLVAIPLAIGGLCGFASSFLLPIAPHRPVQPLQAAPASPSQVRSEFLDIADKCLGGECSLEDVENLLSQLRVQIRSLEEQLRDARRYEGAIRELTGDKMPKSQVKDLIRSVLRAFDVNPDDDQFPQLIRAVGFSGDKFKGERGFDSIPYSTAGAKKR